METRAAEAGKPAHLQDDLRETKAAWTIYSPRIRRWSITAVRAIRKSSAPSAASSRRCYTARALLYLDQNGEGNLDPHAEFSEVETDLHTEEDRGTSFRQMLCIAFDLAVLISYSKEPFFHFVYHDGGLERLQNKLKLALLRVIRDAAPPTASNTSSPP